MLKDERRSLHKFKVIVFLLYGEFNLNFIMPFSGSVRNRSQERILKGSEPGSGLTGKKTSVRRAVAGIVTRTFRLLSQRSIKLRT